MSLSQSVTDAIDKVIMLYISSVSERYNLNKDELSALWRGEELMEKVVQCEVKEEEKVVVKPEEKVVVSEKVVDDGLDKMVVAELKKLCKEKGYKCSGKKQDLIARLRGEEGESALAPVKKSVKSSKSSKEDVENSSSEVIKKLTSKIPSISIRRNQFDNYEHPETGFVFNDKTKKVIGKQNDDGSIEELSAEDINVCKQFKFDYSLPDNLDKKAGLDDVEVEELSDDNEIDEEQLVVEDEEEEIEVEEEEYEEEYEEEVVYEEEYE